MFEYHTWYFEFQVSHCEDNIHNLKQKLSDKQKEVRTMFHYDVVSDRMEVIIYCKASPTKQAENQNQDVNCGSALLIEAFIMF